MENEKTVALPEIQPREGDDHPGPIAPLKGDTPRTDAQAEVHDEASTGGTAGYNDLLEHARQLERELAEAKALYIESARKNVALMVDGLGAPLSATTRRCNLCGMDIPAGATIKECRMSSCPEIAKGPTATVSTTPLISWLRDNAPDCGDNSCLFGGRGKGGMRTNGGCRCMSDLPTKQRIYVERMQAALSTASAIGERE